MAASGAAMTTVFVGWFSAMRVAVVGMSGSGKTTRAQYEGLLREPANAHPKVVRLRRTREADDVVAKLSVS
jgi:ABC-type glutathione transport system ATPase component